MTACRLVRRVCDRSTRLYGLFNKRIYSVPGLWSDLRAVRWGDAFAVWCLHRTPPTTREAIMLAVSRVHDCRYCSFVHRQWALHTGLPLSVITAIEAGDADRRDPAWLAATYAQALAAADFGPVAPLLEATVAVEMTSAERRRVETIARIITIMNRSANTFDALMSRLSGRPADGSRPADEIVVSILAWIVLPPTVIVVCVLRRQAPHKVLRRYWRRPGDGTPDRGDRTDRPA